MAWRQWLGYVGTVVYMVTLDAETKPETVNDISYAIYKTLIKLQTIEMFNLSNS